MSIAVNTKILSVVNFLLLIVLLVVCYQLGKYIMNKGEEVDASEGSCSGRYAE